MGESARSAFVPEGLSDRSQAIHCLEEVQKKEPSRRARYDPYPTWINRPNGGMSIGRNHTVPSGTDSRLDAFQAINCLATFIASLRDNKPPSCPHFRLQTTGLRLKSTNFGCRFSSDTSFQVTVSGND
jgi:hypothetical protein